MEGNKYRQVNSDNFLGFLNKLIKKGGLVFHQSPLVQFWSKCGLECMEFHGYSKQWRAFQDRTFSLVCADISDGYSSFGLNPESFALSN